MSAGANKSEQDSYLPGLNVQAPWAALLISGRKTVETRGYPLPSKYVGKPLALIETPGPNGKFKARIVAIVVFGASQRYTSKIGFYRDRKKHLIEPGNRNYGWEYKGNKSKWGWPVLSVRAVKLKLPREFKRGRIFASRVPVQISL